MFVNPELHGKKRQEQLDESAKKATREHEEAKKNSRFTQVSPKGWERVRELLTDKQGVAALRLYSFLAEHIDPACGAVVADQLIGKFEIKIKFDSAGIRRERRKLPAPH